MAPSTCSGSFLVNCNVAGEVAAALPADRVLSVTGDGRLAALDVAAERWKGASWSEGTGMPMAPLPQRSSYSAGHLLLHLDDDGGKVLAICGTSTWGKCPCAPVMPA